MPLSPQSLAWTAVALSLLSCGGAPPTRIERDEYVGRRVETPERSGLAGGRLAQPDDYLLETPNLRVLVAGAGRRPSERGTVLEARLRSTVADQSLSGWSFGLSLQDRAVPLTVTTMFLVERNDHPAVRVQTVGMVGSRVVHVDRELSLSSVDGVLNVATSIWTGDDEPLVGVRVVELLDWEGATPFAPGVGEITDEEVHRVPWLARDGRTSAVVLGYVGGQMHVRTTFQPHGAERLPGSTRALSPSADVAGGETLRMQAFLTHAHFGVSDAVRRFGWARGKPFSEATAHLPYAPPGSLVRVYSDGAVQMRGRPRPDGGLVIPLPDPTTTTRGRPTKFTISATAWGHAATTPISVAAGQSVVLRIPRGGSVHVVVRDSKGHNIPARIRFESLDTPKQKIELGPDHSAQGALDSAITVSGDVEIPLMPGRFRVRVSRGPEYDLFEQVVEVTESFQPQVSARLTRVVDPGAWVGTDLHLHSAPSPDSQVSLEDRVAALAAEGVRFAVPTDHDYVTSLTEAIAALGVTDFGTVSGVEVTTSEPAIGHFNAYPFPRDASLPGYGTPAHAGLNALQIFDMLHAVPTNPLVQVNHPRMEWGIGYFDVYEYNPTTGEARAGFSDRYDVLEVWNGFDLTRPQIYERVFREWMAILLRGQRVVATGNSDSHTIRSQWAGYPRTWIYAPLGPSKPDELLAALRAGRAFVSNGPFVEATIDDHGPGELVGAVSGNVNVRVAVRAAPWIDVSTVELWVDGALALSEPIVVTPARGNARAVTPPIPTPVARLAKTFSVAVPHDSFVIVRVVGARSMDSYFGKGAILPVAFTNPIFVDGDGDGRTPWATRPSTATDAGRDAGAGDSQVRVH